MRASLRWKTVLLAAGLMLLPTLAFAQSAPPPQTNTPSSPDTVGPSELQNFSLKGSGSKVEEQQPAATLPGPPSPTPARARLTQSSPGPEPRSPRARQTTPSVGPSVGHAAAAKPLAEAPAPAEASLPAPPSRQGALVTAPAAMSQATLPGPSLPAAPAPALASGHNFPILPWILAALFIAAGLLVLLRRRRHQQAFASAAGFDMFAAGEAEPAPEPAPPSRRTAPAQLPPAPFAKPAPAAAAPQPMSVPDRPETRSRTGIVSSRLRPAVEISAQPLRCLIEDERVVIEFELELYNAGTAPARSVLAEASLFNAGVHQEQELAAFFSNPVGAGERLEAIPPMKRMTFTNQVVAPRAAIQEYLLGGRKAFVPVLAFNTLYLWSGGKAQTSAAFLVGRETHGDKLAPLGLERIPRTYGSLAAHLLPTGLRT